jgi:hypothetical protein
MEHLHRQGPESGEFSNTEGLALALDYLQDPSSVPCPSCGPGTMEVVAYLDAHGIRDGVVRAADPDGNYTVVLYCHGCKRAAALDLSPDRPSSGDDGLDSSEDRRAA